MWSQRGLQIGVEENSDTTKPGAWGEELMSSCWSLSSWQSLDNFAKSLVEFFDFPWVALISTCCKHGRRVKEPIFRNGTWIYIRSQLQQMFGKLWQIWRWSGEAAASGSGRSVWLQELRSFATCKTHLALASLASPALAISLTHDDKLQNVFGLLLAWSCKIILLGDCCFLL